MTDIKNVVTKELVEELAKREGVQEYLLESHEAAVLDFYDDNWESIVGPARILIVVD